MESGGCSRCGKAEGKLYKCSGCSAVSYCSKPCQRADWKTHRSSCVAGFTTKIKDLSLNKLFQDNPGDEDEFFDQAKQHIQELAKKAMKGRGGSDASCCVHNATRAQRLKDGPLPLEEIRQSRFYAIKRRNEENRESQLLNEFEKSGILQQRIEAMLQHNTDIFASFSSFSRIKDSEKESFIANHGIDGLASVALLVARTQQEVAGGLTVAKTLRIIVAYFARYPSAHPALWRTVSTLAFVLMIVEDPQIIALLLEIYACVLGTTNKSLRTTIENTWSLLSTCDLIEDLPVDNPHLRALACTVGGAFTMSASPSFEISLQEGQYYLDLLYQCAAIDVAQPLSFAEAALRSLVAFNERSSLKPLISSTRSIDLLLFLSALDLPAYLDEALAKLKQPSTPHLKLLSSPLNFSYFTPTTHLLQDNTKINNSSFLVSTRVALEVYSMHVPLEVDPLLVFNQVIWPPHHLYCAGLLTHYVNNSEPITGASIWRIAALLANGPGEKYEEQPLTVKTLSSGTPFSARSHDKVLPVDYDIPNLTKQSQFPENAYPESRFRDFITAPAPVTPEEADLWANPSNSTHLELPSETLSVHPALSSAAIKMLINALNVREGKVAPIKLAAWLHFCILRIRPFRQHNSAVARFLTNWFLLRNGFCPVVFYDRQRYDATKYNLQEFYFYILSCLTRIFVVLRVVQERLFSSPPVSLSAKQKAKVGRLKEDGNLCYKKGETDKALDLYNQALQIDSADLRLYTNCALCQIKNENFSDAITTLFRAACIDSNDVKTRYLQGRALEGLKRFMDAKHAYRIALNQARANGNSAVSDISFRVKACESNLNRNSDVIDNEDMIGHIETDQSESILNSEPFEGHQLHPQGLPIAKLFHSDSLYQPDFDESLDAFLERAVPTSITTPGFIQVHSSSTILNIAHQIFCKQDSNLRDFAQQLYSKECTMDITQKNNSLFAKARDNGITLNFDHIEAPPSDELLTTCRNILNWKDSNPRDMQKSILLEASNAKCCLGRWFVICTPLEVCEKWRTIATATWNQELGISASVSTSGQAEFLGNYLISVYTSSFLSKQDALKVREQLSNLGFKNRLNYKPEISTYLDLGPESESRNILYQQ